MSSHGRRPTSVSSDSESSSDSENNLQYTHNSLPVHAKSNDPVCSKKGLPSHVACNPSCTPFHPPMPQFVYSLVNGPITRSISHMLRHKYAERVPEQLKCSNSMGSPNTSNYEVSYSGRSETAGTPSVPNMSSGDTATAFSYKTSADIPSSSSQINRQKPRLKRSDLSEVPFSTGMPCTCTSSHPVQSSVGSTDLPIPTEDTSSVSHMPNTMVQPSSTSQANPIVDDNSDDVQFISEERSSSTNSASLHPSERKKKRRRMCAGISGKTYVSDDVIILHDNLESGPTQLQHTVPVPGPSSSNIRQITSTTSLTSDACLPKKNLNSTRARSKVRGRFNPPPINNLDLGNRDAVSEDTTETGGTTKRVLSDDGMTIWERCTTSDSVVAITPTDELEASSTPKPSTDLTQEEDEIMHAARTFSCGRVAVPIFPQSVNLIYDVKDDPSGSESGQLFPEQFVKDMDVNSRPRSLQVKVTEDHFDYWIGRTTPEADDDDVEILPRRSPTVKAIACRPPLLSGTTKNDPDYADRLVSHVLSVTALLECPVCFELMRPPIYQCRLGHIVCRSCKPKLRECPTCRSSFSENRNTIAEMFAEKLAYPCKNSDSGCSDFFMLNEKKDHEANCSFRF